MSDFNLGTVTAYGYAKDKGYTGTEDEFAALMASYADVAEQAAASATTATAKASEAAQSATAAASSKTAAETAQGGAETAAQTATTKAGEASASATTASGKATEATTAAGTATTKASEATTAATTATTKAGEASTSATNAAASATRAQEILDSIPEDYSQLSEDVSDLKDGFDDLKDDFVGIQEGKLPFFIVKNEYINATNGAFQHYNGWDRTELIPVSEYSSIRVKSTVSSGYNAYYKADGTFWSQVAVGTVEKEIAVPIEASYVAFSNSATGMANFEATFVKKIDGKIDILNKGLNDSQCGFLPLGLVRNEFVDSDGKFAISIGYSRTGFVYVGDAIQLIIDTEVASNYNCFYTKDKEFIDTFSLLSGENIVAVPRNVAYIALSGGTNAMLTMTVKASKIRQPEYDYTEGNNAYVYPDIRETVYSYDNGLTYAIEDGVITINGTLSQTTFVLDLPEVILDGYHIFNVEVLGGSYTGSAVLMLLPTTNPPYIINLDGHITRLDYFDNETRAVRIYASNNTTFDELKFRIWIVPGLVNHPYDSPHYYVPVPSVIGCRVGDYNAPSYPRIGDGTIYNVFGDKFAVCKDGMLSKMQADSEIKFGLLADLHYGYQDVDHENFYKRIYEKLSEHSIDFSLMLGDIIDAGYFSMSAKYHAQMTQYNNSIQALKCPNYPFSGNHDDDASEFSHHGCVDYGNARFVYFWADYDGASGGGLVKDSELAWIEQQLSASTASIKILMCHYAVSTDNGFGWYIADATTRENIQTIANSNGVKLFLNGHEHDHNISVGTAGQMTDINLPNGQFAYTVCTIDKNGAFTATVYDSETDSVIKTINVPLI